ncbi:hypothetical protein AOLI_G00068440 [Acnodon oligacanthus]
MHPIRRSRCGSTCSPQERISGGPELVITALASSSSPHAVRNRTFTLSADAAVYRLAAVLGNSLQFPGSVSEAAAVVERPNEGTSRSFLHCTQPPPQSKGPRTPASANAHLN